MGCNCASQEQIRKLYEAYGDKNKEYKNKNIFQKINNIIRNIFLIFCLILISPFLMTYVFYMGFFSNDKKISIRKLFRLNKYEDINYSKNVQHQQNI